jgi:pilus assembly protein Flp/PilA
MSHCQNHPPSVSYLKRQEAALAHPTPHTTASAPSIARQRLIALLQDDSGQDMIEYALACALIGLGAVASIKGLAPKISNAYSSVNSQLSSAI